MGFRVPERAITLEEYRRLEADLGRPLTDAPIGGYSDAKRETGAQHSELFTDHSHLTGRRVRSDMATRPSEPRTDTYGLPPTPRIRKKPT